MKQIKLVVLSLLALAFARPVGFCTANNEAPPTERALEDYTVDELKEIAPHYSVEITASMKKADIVSAIKSAAGYNSRNIESKPEDRLSALEQRVEQLAEENARLRAASPVAIEPTTGLDNTTTLLIQGAGVKAEDVTWRIRAGLSPAQAVEVALNEKNEREAATTEEAKK